MFQLPLELLPAPACLCSFSAVNLPEFSAVVFLPSVVKGAQA
jgi:hypothetical protein